MTSARPSPQTTCVTERWLSTCAIDDATITGTSATDVVSIGEQFQFPMPGNG